MEEKKTCTICWYNFEKKDLIYIPDLHTNLKIEHLSTEDDLVQTKRFKKILFIVLATVLFASLLAVFINFSYLALITGIHPIFLSLISFATILPILGLTINLLIDNKKSIRIEKRSFHDYASICAKCSSETREELKRKGETKDPFNYCQDKLVKCFYSTTIDKLDKDNYATNKGLEINFSKA